MPVICFDIHRVFEIEDVLQHESLSIKITTLDGTILNYKARHFCNHIYNLNFDIFTKNRFPNCNGIFFVRYEENIPEETYIKKFITLQPNQIEIDNIIQELEFGDADFTPFHSNVTYLSTQCRIRVIRIIVRSLQEMFGDRKCDISKIFLMSKKYEHKVYNDSCNKPEDYYSNISKKLTQMKTKHL